MKKTLILSTQPIANETKNISAFVRIAKFMRDNLSDVEIISDNFDKYRKEIDNIIVAYGTFYADFKSIMTFLEYHPHQRYFYLVNEYGLVPNGDIYRFLIKHNYEVIANYEVDSVGAKHYIDFNMLNLNLTAHRDIQTLPFHKRSKNLIYWGTYRPNRKEYFEKYFDDITISTSVKSRKKFNELCHKNNFNKVNFIEPIYFNEYSVLNHYKYSIYIEDKYTHTHFNHMADRFYEAISMGIIQFFDKNVKENILKSGYPIDDFYIVNSRAEITAKIKEIEKNPTVHIENLHKLNKIAKLQQKKFIKKLNDLLNSDKKEPKLSCPYCIQKCYQYFKCQDCGKSICSCCLQIIKKHYCMDCAKKYKKETQKEEILF